MLLPPQPSPLISCRVHEKLMGEIIVPASQRVSCEVEALPQELGSLTALLAQPQAPQQQ